MHIRSAMLVLALPAAASLAVTLRPVDLSEFYNSRRQTYCCNSADYPGGLATYLGVPFNLGPYGDLNTVTPLGSGTITTTIPVNRRSVLRAFTLLNTAWGAAGPNAYIRVEFESDLGDIAAFDLVSDVNVRDHAQTFYTCCIDPGAGPTHTQVAWSAGSVRADMQTYILPPAFADRTLKEIRLIDSGASGFQRSLLFALSTEDDFCYADLNGDDLVDDTDFSRFAEQYSALACSDPSMPFNCSADLNFDGLVDDQDFQIFVVAYNTLLCEP